VLDLVGVPGQSIDQNDFTVVRHCLVVV
jgi:hypothetical protein